MNSLLEWHVLESASNVILQGIDGVSACKVCDSSAIRCSSSCGVQLMFKKKGSRSCALKGTPLMPNTSVL